MTTTSLRRTAATRLPAALAVAVLLTFGAAAPASAHDGVISTSPADGDTALTSVPDKFAITTSQDMLVVEGSDGLLLDSFGMTVTDSAGSFYGDGCLDVAGPTMTMGAGLGAAGEYSMTYQYVSADGHPTSGAVDFTYAPTGDAAVQTGLAEPPVCGEASVTGEAPAEPAPSEVPDASAEPEATDEAATPAPSDDEAATEASDVDETGVVLGIVGGVLALLLIAGIVTAIVLRRRGAGAESTPVD